MEAQVIPFLIASILLTISPGPDIIYVLVQSISNGRKAGIVTALGLVTGIIVHTTLVAFGVSALIKESDILFLIIKIFGACYLFFLAYKIYRSEAGIAVTSKDNILKGGALFQRGFIMNVLNPKVTIFFLAFFPGFLWEPEGNTVLQFYLLGGLFFIQALVIFTLVSIFAGSISKYITANSRSAFYLKWLQVLVFIGIGILILI